MVHLIPKTFPHKGCDVPAVGWEGDKADVYGGGQRERANAVDGCRPPQGRKGRQGLRSLHYRSFVNFDASYCGQ